MRWTAFLKKKKAIVKVDLTTVIQMLQTLLIPIVETITEGKDCPVSWNHRLKDWQWECKIKCVS